MTEKQIKALKRNGEYWKQRFDILDTAGAKYELEVYKEVEGAFMQAQRDIQRDIDSWLSRLAKNNNVSLYEAKKMLAENELKEFKWDVKQYIKYGEGNALNGKWMKQLENASAKFHISQLEAIKVRTQQSLEKAFRAEIDIVDRMAHKTFTDGYYKSAFEMQKGLGVGWRIGEIDQRKLDKIVSKPWTADGKTFSDRIWERKNQMVNDLHQELTRNCIYGRSLEDTIKQMEQYVDKSVKNARYAAKRLVVTENAAFRIKGHYEGLKEVGTEKYEIMLTVDAKTCPVCIEMNGRVFSMSEFQVGVTAPPFHPNCETGTLVPVTEDWDEILNGEELDDPEFEEWLDRFTGDAVDKSDENGIINKSAFVTATNIAEAEEYAQNMFANDVSYSGAKNIENVNAVNKTLTKLTSEYPIDSLSRISTNGRLKSANAKANGGTLEINTGYLNNPGKAINWSARISDYPQRIANYKTKIESGILSKSAITQLNKEIKRMEDEMRFSRWSVSSSAEDCLTSTITHEYGHILADQLFGQINGSHFCSDYSGMSTVRQLVRETFYKARQTGDIFNISMYANSNECEFFAECFAAIQNGEKMPDYIKKMFKEVLKK